MNAPHSMPLRVRNLVIAISGLCLLGVAYWIYGRPASTLSGPADGLQTHVVAVERPISKQLQLTGTLSPKEQQTVTAPFDGLVLAKQVSLGQRVSTGEVLARVNPRDIEIQLREAEAALIKAEQRLADLKDWKNGLEVHKARRELDRSERHFDTLTRRVEQSKKLLDIGIIPASEYEGELQQLDDQRMDVASAREALASTLEQGDEAGLAIATLELKNAEIMAGNLREKVAEAVIRAPINGVVVAAKTPDSGSGGAGGSLNFDVGDKVKEGQALFSIANIEELIVQSSISEIDINSVELGQTATIVSESLPGLTMTGQLTKIAYQAQTDSADLSRFPSFGIELALDTVPPEQRVRLGITVQLAMDVYHKDHAIVVPFDAIEDGMSGTYARIVTDDGVLERRPVQLGASFVDGVEVLSGLQQGDVLAVAEMPQDYDDEI